MSFVLDAPEKAASNWALVSSSALMLIPFVYSLWTMPFFYSIVIASSGIWSFLYHLSAQKHFGDTDFFSANLLGILNLCFFFAVTGHVSYFDPRVIVALLAGAAALALLFGYGYAPEQKDSQETDYEIYHSAWHVLAMISCVCIISLHKNFGHPWSHTMLQVFSGKK